MLAGRTGAREQSHWIGEHVRAIATGALDVEPPVREPSCAVRGDLDAEFDQQGHPSCLTAVVTAHGANRLVDYNGRPPGFGPTSTKNPRSRNRVTNGLLRRAPAMGLVRRLFGSKDHIALLVDGPNVLREEFSVDLAAVREAVDEDGEPTIARIYLDEHASPGLIRAAEANGFEVIVTSGDVDVKLAVDATALVEGAGIDTLAIASRDADFKPVLERAAASGVRTIAVAPGEHGRSAALVNAADDAIVLEPREV